MIHATTWRDPENIMLNKISQILYDPTYMRYTEQANPQRQKVD